jgi:hypothetical protein
MSTRFPSFFPNLKKGLQVIGVSKPSQPTRENAGGRLERTKISTNKFKPQTHIKPSNATRAERHSHENNVRRWKVVCHSGPDSDSEFTNFRVVVGRGKKKMVHNLI